MKGIKLLVFLILTPYFFLFINIKKIFNISFYTLECRRLGVLSKVPEIFLRKYGKIYKRSKTVIFLRSSKESTNEFILKKYFELFKLNNITVIKYNIFILLLDFCNTYYSKKLFSQPLPVERKHFDVFNKKKLFKLNSSEIEKGYKILNNFGLNKKSKWVCIHNRDSDFLKKTQKGNFDYHNYRDFSINDYEKAIEFIVKKGFFVFRIGKHTNEKLNVSKKNNHVIDLPNHKIRSDFFETFLINNCSFYLGTSSGPVCVARMLRKKIFLINISPLESIFAENWNYPVIFKKVFNKKEKRFLSMKQIIEKDIYHVVDTNKLNQKGLKFIDNNKEEILKYVKEIFQYLKLNKFNFNKKYRKKRKEFNILLRKNEYLKQMNYKNPIGESFFLSLKIR